MMGDTTVPTLSTTLLSTTLKRGPGGNAVEYGNVDLATQLIKVTVLFWFISTDSHAALQQDSKASDQQMFKVELSPRISQV